MLRWKSLRFAALTVICASVWACNAFAGAITIYNTGEGDNGMALPVGLIGLQLQPYLRSTRRSVNGHYHVSQWIVDQEPAHSGLDKSWQVGGGTNWPGGTYDYQTTFSLAGFNPLTAELSGVSVDFSDNDACIYLNGVNADVCTGPPGDFGRLIPFSITSGFRSWHKHTRLCGY